MTQPLSVVPHEAVSIKRPTNMITASWIKPQRRPILTARQPHSTNPAPLMRTHQSPKKPTRICPIRMPMTSR